MDMRIIIVDDENVFREYIKSMELWSEGRYVLAGEARSSAEALELLKRTEADVVLTDVCMPGENGIYLTARIAHDFPKVAMVAISSYDNYDYVREILKNGAHDYILKNRLTQKLLEATLENIERSNETLSGEQRKQQDRNTLRAWIEDGVRLPLQWEGKRKTFLLCSLQSLETLEEELKMNYRKGILNVLENQGSSDSEITANYFQNGYFVVMICFSDFITEAELQQQTEICRMRAVNNIRRIYHLNFDIKICPQMSSEQALLSFIRHCFRQQEVPADKTKNLALSLKQRKSLYIALESNNIDLASALIGQIYHDIGEREYGRTMMITAELLEILERACMDVNIRLDFIPRNEKLYDYVKKKSKTVLVNSITGLYRNALKEIMSHRVTYSEKVMAAIEFMNERFDTINGAGDVADQIGASASYLSRIFHMETGKTLVNYLNEIRIEKAKSYLQLKDRPLKEVVSLCGFNNYSYFMSVFKEYTGRTPKEYQNELS